MRILLISKGYPSHTDGRAEPLAVQVVRGLQQRGHTLQVLTTRQSDPATRVENAVHYQLEPDINETSRVPVPVQFLLQRKSRERRNAQYLQQVLSEFKPDVTVLWNLKGLQRRLIWIVEQTPGTQPVYYASGTSPLQPDAYTAYWESFLQRPDKVPLRKQVSRVALRQLRLENPGVLRLDFVIEQPDHVEAESASERLLDEVEAALNQARGQRRLGPPLPPARSRPLFDLKRWVSRPIQVTNSWHARLSDDRHLSLAAQWLGVAQAVTGRPSSSTRQNVNGCLLIPKRPAMPFPLCYTMRSSRTTNNCASACGACHNFF